LDLGQEDRQYLYAVGKVIKRAIDNEKKVFIMHDLSLILRIGR